MMRATAGALITAAIMLATAGTPDALAQGKAGDDVQVPSAGNWSRAKSVDEARGATGEAGTATNRAATTSSSGDVPIPRPKPGSKAAKAEAKAAQEAAKTEAVEADDKKETAAVPSPRAKPVDKKPVQAGLPTASGDSSAPYRGNLDKDEIKSVLSGKTVLARVDGKDARITLADDGRLSWRASGGSGSGFWWAEKGRMCDRFDPSGDFPGRGAGCRSFEQRGAEYYAGGKPINFAN